MGKPHPVELRDRAVRLVEQGCTHTEAARRLCVSIKFVNDMVRLKRETGSLVPKRCVFRNMRPPIPITSGHLFRRIRPPVTRCREAACFGYQA